MRQIDIVNHSRLVGVDKSRLRSFIRALDKFLPENLHAPEGVLSIAIMDDEEIAKIHADFLQKPDPTDVITFDGDPDDDFAGEICISAQTAKSNAPKFENVPHRELALYAAHGYLHLAGVNDISPTQAKEMRAAEKLCLDIFDKKFRKQIFTFKERTSPC